MAKRTSIYIEDKAINVLVTDGAQVDRWATANLDDGLVNEGVIQDEDRVAEAIKQLFDFQKISAGSVVTCVSGLNSVSRIISIPKVSRDVLQEAMPLSQVFYSYQPLPSGKDEMRLFLTAYPRNSTESLLGTMNKAGLKVESLDVAPLALARCVDAGQAIIVNTWLGYADIVITSERIPLVARSVSLPIESGSHEEKWEALTEELNRTISFYNTTYPEKQLDRSVEILMSGDILGEKDLASHFEKLGFKTGPIQSPFSAAESFDPSGFMINIGLALKGKTPGGTASQRSIIDFNALPQAYQAPAFSWFRVLAPIGVVAALAILAYGTYSLVTLRGDVSKLKTQYSQLQSQADALRKANAAIQVDIKTQQDQSTALSGQADGIQAQIDSSNADATFFQSTLNNLTSGLNDCDKDVRELVNDIPKGLTVNQISYDTAAVSINGQAPTQDLILAYAKAIRISGRFNTVDISSIEQAPGAGLTFTLRLS
jgi:type IV pilus assembly protein PilM